jgi:hypothetical protein
MFSPSPVVNVAPNQRLSLARKPENLAERKGRVRPDRSIKPPPHVV